MLKEVVWGGQNKAEKDRKGKWLAEEVDGTWSMACLMFLLLDNSRRGPHVQNSFNRGGRYAATAVSNSATCKKSKLLVLPPTSSFLQAVLLPPAPIKVGTEHTSNQHRTKKVQVKLWNILSPSVSATPWFNSSCIWSYQLKSLADSFLLFIFQSHMAEERNLLHGSYITINMRFRHLTNVLNTYVQ